MKIFSLIIVLLVFTELSAQNNIGIKYFALSIHPQGENDNSFLMPNKLDKDGYFVLNIGGEITYEYFLYKDILSLKLIQAVYADCAARLGGFSHFGVRGKIIKSGKHSLYGGIGPTLVYRRNWLEMDGYINQNRFKGELEKKWQYLFIWYGGEFEYKYAFNNKLDFAASFVPGFPDLMSLAFGLNYKFQ
ncbi:MAG: hypothetical protein JZU47_14980 [Prolixibacteraceae bacterium]|nr:hypothetical protein [Prolixibacteraceae bacterium]